MGSSDLKKPSSGPANDALKQIPVYPENIAASTMLHPARRALQYLTLLILVLIPLTGLFRIDMEAGAFILLGRQVWFSDITIIFGFWLFVASLLVMSYSLVGSAFCGWMCPQNTASEFADMLTRKLLGRSTDMMDISGKKMQVSIRNRSLLNYLLFGIGVLLPAMIYALVPLLYFNDPSVIWSFITCAESARETGSLYWIYLIFTALFLIDIASVRHFWCKNICFYRVWQESFRKPESLRVHYDVPRSHHCAGCHYCVDACFFDLDPRTTGVIDHCVNCGACVTACDVLHSKSRKLKGPGLLSFVTGRHDRSSGQGHAVGSFLSRFRGGLLATLAGLLLLAIGVGSYQSEYLSVYKEAEGKDGKVLDYRVHLAHKLFQPADVTLQIEGLDPAVYELQQKHVHFDTAGSVDVMLHLHANMSAGLHRFIVRASVENDWSEAFRVTHFVADKQPGG